MQVPGLDELEASVARAVRTLDGFADENDELKTRMAAVGKEIDNLMTQIRGIGSGQKLDSSKKKSITQRLKSIADKLTQA